MDDSIIFRSFLLVILLGCSAFFAASEAAFFSLNELQLSTFREKRGRAGRLVNSLLEKPRELLVTIYIGNEIANVATSAIVTSIAILIFGSLGVSLAIGFATFLILVFGEIAPKTLSLKFAENFSLVAAYPLKAFSTIIQPARNLFTHLSEKTLFKLGIKHVQDQEPSITEEEFKAIVDMGEGAGIIEAEEREMIRNVFDFSNTTVGEIMTPKIDMFSLNEDESLDEILPKIVENFYSRVPVYGKNNADDKEEKPIIGILFTKDLNHFKLLPKDKFNLKNILHEPLFVPQSKKIKELLQEFKKEKRHLAIVLDEYGSVCGLVTLEDIIEELVGEIDSEMRPEENPILQIKPDHYRLSGTYSVSEFNEYFVSDLPENEYDTIGGLVFGLIGRVPRSGEAVTLKNFKFVVEKMKGPRIVKLYLTVLAPEIKKEKPERLLRKDASNGS